MTAMAAQSLDEFALIERLAERLGGRLPEGVIGIGDDCAAVPRGGGWQLFTCDVAMGGRHFLPGRTPMADVGWRVASANVSDICACGGLPCHALVSLGVPPAQPFEALDALYDGLAEAEAAYGFHVLGGNVSGAPELLVDLFMTGETPRFVSRGGARPGELIAVSGALGGAAAGLEAFREKRASLAARALIRRHLRPRARTDLVPLVRAAASAAIDISDGLASELNHLARRSGACLAVESDRIPRHEALPDYAAERGGSPLAWALESGEEYELLFTLPTAERGRLAGMDVTVIGEVRSGRGVLLDERALPPGGWDHLRQGS
jgi:thiamine-monophosphate kinase